MTPCDEISNFCASPRLPLPGLQAKAWVDHVGGCNNCATTLYSSPDAAAEILESSHGETDDYSELVPIHGAIMALGTTLIKQLPSSTVDSLNSPDDMESLRDELRHAAGVAAASPAEIRAAVAVSELSAALEGLVFQRAFGDADPVFIQRSGAIDQEGVIAVGIQQVPAQYLIERIRDAIGTGVSPVVELLEQVRRLLCDEILTIPGFDTAVESTKITLHLTDGFDRAADEQNKITVDHIYATPEIEQRGHGEVAVPGTGRRP